MVSTIPGGAGFLPSTVSLLVSTSKSSDFGSARDQVVATSRMTEQNIEGWSCISITDISVTPWEIDPRPRLWTGSHPWHRLGSNRGFFFLQNHFWQRLQPRTFQFMTKNGDANEKHDSWPMKLLMWKKRAPFAKVVASSHEPPLRQWVLSGPRTGLMCGNSVLGTAQVTSNWATTCHMCKFLCQGRYIGVPKNLKISHDDHYFCYHSDVDINVIT